MTSKSAHLLKFTLFACLATHQPWSNNLVLQPASVRGWITCQRAKPAPKAPLYFVVHNKALEIIYAPIWGLSLSTAHYSRIAQSKTNITEIYTRKNLTELIFYPSGPRAESARAVTGRRCPHSVKGEDFLQSHKNPVRASAMLTGKFLQIRKVFATSSLLAEEFPDTLQYKISR